MFRDLYADRGIVPDQPLVLHTAQMFRACSVKYVRLYAHAKELLKARRKQHLRGVFLYSRRRFCNSRRFIFIMQ